MGPSLLAGLLGAAGPALACAGLIGSNGAVNLGLTTSLAAYHDGVEQYVTAFKLRAGGGQFGTLIPLPAVPSNLERGGAWTLHGLVLETQAQRASPAAALASGGDVVQQVRIHALDPTVLKGGVAVVAEWAHAHGLFADAGCAGLLRRSQSCVSRRRSARLLSDLRGDASMQVPASGWLTEVGVNSRVSDLKVRPGRGCQWTGTAAAGGVATRVKRLSGIGQLLAAVSSEGSRTRRSSGRARGSPPRDRSISLPDSD